MMQSLKRRILGAPVESGPAPTGLQALGIGSAACLITVITSANSQAVLLALPSIGKDLDIPTSNLQWLQSAYSLAFGCSLLLAGRLADVYGRKLLYMIGIIWFAIWTLACGFMQTEIGIDIARAMSGIGAAASIPSAIGIIAENLPPGPYRTLCFAAFGAGAPLGASIGMILGGVITEYISWRPVFWLLAGTALVPLILGWLVIPNREPVKGENSRVDWIGAALVTVGLVLLLFALADGNNAPQGWKTPYILVLLVVAIIALTAFIFWLHYAATRTNTPPLMRLTLFTRGKGKLAVIYASIFLCFAAFSSFWLLTDLYYQDYIGLSPILTMIRYLPCPVSGVICNLIVGFLASKVKAQVLICIGTLGTALAPLLFAVMPLGKVYWQYEFPAMIITVLGADFIMATGLIVISKLVLADEQSTAGALFQTMTQIGAAIGLAINTIVYTTVEESKARGMGSAANAGDADFPPEAFRQGLKMAFYAAAAMSFVSLLISGFGLRGLGYSQDKKAKGEADSSSPEDSAIELEKQDALEYQLESGGKAKNAEDEVGIVFAEQDLGGLVMPVTTRGSITSKKGFRG